MMKKKNILLFASGNGSNVQAIIDYFRGNDAVDPCLIITNNPEAGVLNIANKEEINFSIIDQQQLKSKEFVELLKSYEPALIILAGFLKKIPSTLVQAFPNKIINIHPALLPKYGGKGMYGAKVHNAVIENKELQSGISIHYVNEHYDEGNIILQATCNVEEGDSLTTLSNKIHKLEHFYYPRVIEFLLINEKAE